MASGLRLTRRNPTGHVDPAARVAVVVAGAFGLLAGALAGIIDRPLWLAATAVLVIVGRRPAGTPSTERLHVLLVLVTAGLCGLQLGVAGSQEGSTVRDVLGPALVAVQLLHARTWRSRRDLQVGLIVAIGLLVLAASYAPDLVVGLPLLAGWAAVVTAVALLVRGRPLEDVDVVAPGGVSPRGPIVAVVASALALGIAAFLLIPQPSQAGIHSSLGSSTPEAGSTADGQAAAGERAGALTGDQLDMRTRGSLSASRNIAEVPKDSPQLWRNRSYDTYQGGTWSSADQQVRQLAGSSPYVLGTTALPTRTDHVEVLAREGTLWAPSPALVSVALDGRLAVGSDGQLIGSRRTTAYDVTTVAAVPSDEQLDRTGVDPDLAGDSTYLQLPDTLPARVGELARQITADATTPRAKVAAIETWLHDNATYNLSSRVPGVQEDDVDAFLFVDKEGFCEQFAAAEVVLLRSVGVPARLVTGLAYGVDTGGGTRTFRESDLHAWVEVPYDGVGWVASDPTAGAAQSTAAGLDLRGRVAAFLRDLLATADRFPGGKIALGVVVVGAVALVAFLLRRRDRRRGDTAAAVEERALAEDPVAFGEGALAAFLRLDRRLGPMRRVPAESLRELRTRLPAVREALAVVEQECYAPMPPGEDVTGAAVEALDAYAPGLVAPSD